ncbi:hypothetical protein DP065_02530 [[Mycoplasma] anseris]|uniref:Uncharacterized protein n=1 Tax=[Mycoplasma] anseris TaxID=92400 RepID=A0A2Z4NDU9_9BACT|nr:hypothetical protein DP065_02530 [[Mycoplasma] anseris]
MNFEIPEVIKKVKETFGKKVSDELKQIKFFREGFHNHTYIGKYKDIWVQIRIPKNIVDINYDSEKKLVAQFKDYLFVQDGLIIKKWFPGQDLFKLEINDKIINSVFNCIMSFQKLSADINKFDWNAYKINDPKYHQILAKYKDEKLVITHNNLKRHNVLINKYGFIKLIDFEFASYNSRYVDPVSLHLFLGIDKQKIIDFFKLKEEKFDDYLYLLKTFSKATYNNVYAKIKTPENKISDSLLEWENRDYSISNRFIAQKYYNQFDNQLEIKEIEKFYFVPCCVYEDRDRIIWRWLNCSPTTMINSRQMKVLARALRNLHDSDAKFPKFILKEKIDYYFNQIPKDELNSDFENNQELLDDIFSWIKNVKPDANCHNYLNLNNIYFTNNINIYIINWSRAYYSNRFIDIAILFEHINASKYLEQVFWRSYDMFEPKDFYKYRIIAYFAAYLYNKVLDGDYTQTGINIKKIKEIYNNRG